MGQTTLDMLPFQGFESASRAVLGFLRGRIDMGLWMMTRTEGAEWIVLQADDRAYGIQDGAVFQWADSFCSRMVGGDGPRIAPSSAEIPVFVEALINEQAEIGAYIGVPVCKDDGSLFGTLCAIDPKEQAESLRNELPLIELCGKLLGTILSHELRTVEQERVLERSRRDAITDCLTGIFNRHGWESVIAHEEARASRYGSPTGIAVLDLDNLKEINDTQGHAAGDDLLRRTAQVLNSAVRQGDIVARFGGDEFGVLCVECNGLELNNVVDRIREALAHAGIMASIGWATRQPQLGLQHAVREADRSMYQEKASRRSLQ
jgi:diguanylate cyclase (GGDEF)-like protein